MNDGMASDFMTHLTSGAAVVYIIEGLKASGRVPWLTADTKTVNKMASAIAAACLAFGITATGDASTGWIVQIPSATVLLSGVWHWLEQWVIQQGYYDLVAQKSGKGAV